MIHQKPKNEIFASDAKAGEIVEFPNVKRGWGVTENLGFIPPMEYFNAAFNRVDKALAYQSQRGVSEWSADEEYPIGALSVFDAKLYQAKTQNTNKKPSENKDAWEAIADKEWCENSFLKKTDKIDAYTKQESDDKFALKSDITDGVKIGSYLLWSSQSVTPTGFLACDGRSLKKSEYAELFAVIGYTYGGSGENFNIPVFNDGRFFRSTGGQASALGVKQKGSPHIIDVKNDAVWTLGLQAPAADLNSLGFDKLTGGISEKLFTIYGQTLGAYIADTAIKSYSDHVHVAAIRPENSSVVVLIKAKDVKEPSANQIDKSIYATETKAGITKLKNSVTGKAEDAAITEKAASEIKGQILGIGQSLQNMTGQRQANKNYENTTGRAIALQFSNAVTVEVGGQSVTSNFFIIPPNTTYKAATMPTAWFELR